MQTICTIIWQPSFTDIITHKQTENLRDDKKFGEIKAKHRFEIPQVLTDGKFRTISTSAMATIYDVC